MHAHSPSTLAAPRSRMLSSISAATFAFVAAIGGPGCFDWAEGGTQRMTAGERDEVAAALGAMIAAEEEGQGRAFGGAIGIARGELPRGFRMSGEVASAAVGGIDYDLAAVCSDELGRGALCGRGAAVAHVEARWSGEVSGEGFDASASFDADWVLEALDEEVIALDGYGRGAATVGVLREDAADELAVARTWRIDYRARYDAVGLDEATRRPISGVVRYALNVERVPTGHGAEVERRFALGCELSWQADGAALIAFDDGATYRAEPDGSVARVR